MDRLASSRSRAAALLRYGSSCDSAFGDKQIPGVLVYIDPLATATIATRAAHRVIQGCEPSRVCEINVGALLQKILDDIVPAPKRRAVERSLQQAARAPIQFAPMREQQLQRRDSALLNIHSTVVAARVGIHRSHTRSRYH